MVFSYRSDLNFSDSGKTLWPNFCSCDFAVWEAPGSLNQFIDVILRIERKQNYYENLESVPAAFAKLSWNFQLSLSCCNARDANRQYITGLLIYYWDMTCSNELHLKKSRSVRRVLGPNIDVSFGPNGAPLGALWWSTLRAASRSS